MRTALAIALATMIGGIALAGERAGKVVRVEQPPRREVFVPAGAFWLGPRVGWRVLAPDPADSRPECASQAWRVARLGHHGPTMIATYSQLPAKLSPYMRYSVP